MHRTEGPDDDAGMYTEDDFGTVINKEAMNAIQEEIAGPIEASGQTLRASGPLDAAGSWGQLLTAIRTLAGLGGATGVVNPADGRHLGSSGGVLKAVTSANQTITDLYHFTLLDAETGGPFLNGLIRLEEHADYANRTIVIGNFTGTQKKIGSTTAIATHYAFVPNGYFMTFIYMGGYWYPVRAFIPETADHITEGSTNKFFNGKDADDLAEGSTNKYFNGKDTDDLPEGSSNLFNRYEATEVAITVELRDQASNLEATLSAFYRIVESAVGPDTVHLTIPAASGTITTPGLLYITAVSNAALPDAIMPSTVVSAPIIADDSGTDLQMTVAIINEGGAKKIYTTMAFTTDYALGAQTITWPLL